MRKIPAFAVLLGLLAFSAQPAHAYPSEHQGECHMVATNDTAGGTNAFVGLMVAAIAVYDTADVTRPASANVACTVRVNGVFHDGYVTSGTTTVLAAGLVRFVARPTDAVHVCTEVYYWDGTPSPAPDCRLAARADVSEDPVLNLAEFAMRTLNPVLCVVLPIVRGVPGVLETDPEGDVYVRGSRVYDCPPYEGTGIHISGSGGPVFYVA